jgi:hypothetical protein
MLRNLRLSLVAVIGLVAVSQSASAQACRTTIGILFEATAGAACPRGSTSVSWNVTGPQRPLHVSESVSSAPSPGIFPGAVSGSVFTHAAESVASQPPYLTNIDT